MSEAPPEVFQYLDYRAYLRDLYAFRKAQGRGFSYRSFSRRAGLRSSNFLKLVLDGERNLAPDTARRVAAACNLSGEEADYFADLVAFNQARTADERNACYARLTGFRQYRSAHRLELAHAEYHSTWYLPAIRELATREDFQDDPDWIGRRLRPPVPYTEIARAMRTLLDLGLLVREEDGRVRQGEAVVSTGAQTRGLYIGNYHRSMMERAAASIELFPAAQRDLSALTLCIGADALPGLKERIARFRRELIDLATAEASPRQVVQVNLQLFPLTTDE